MNRQIIGAALLLAIVNTGAEARDLTFASWGGGYTDAQRAAYFKPFTGSKGIAFAEDTYLGGLAEIKTMVETGQVKWDLVIVERNDLQLGCDEGLFEKLDWNVLGGGVDLMPAAVHPCGAGNVVAATGIAYNTATIGQKVPQTWSDFWDVKTWPGKRALRAGPKMNLEFALLADGVAAKDIYATLATPAGLDQAFAKLDQIKSELQFWEAGAQPVEWLAAGNVVMSSSYNGRITNAVAEGKPLGFNWNDVQYAIDSWAVPTGAPNKKLAMEFISFANTPEPQAKFSEGIPYGPTNVKAAALMLPDLLARIPAGENIASGFVSDEDFWTDNIDQISVRWNSWVSR